ncbi:MAG TPA: fibronectin type III domain-containing protein [Gemmatimonadales bacterium]|nr:fibronectin type III domain-containing protein [Gemmatimonadales bacterium]
MRAKYMQDDEIATFGLRGSEPGHACSGLEHHYSGLEHASSGAEFVYSNAELHDSAAELSDSAARPGNFRLEDACRGSGHARSAVRHPCSPAEQAFPAPGHARHGLVSASSVSEYACFAVEQACLALGSGTLLAATATVESPHAWPRPPPAGNTASPLCIRSPSRGRRRTNTQDPKRKGRSMRFPKREPDIARLAQDLVAGLRGHPEAFPNSPVSADELEAALTKYNGSREAAIVLHAQAAKGTAAKDEDLVAMVDLMKTAIRHAENLADGDAGTLQLIGWGARRSRSPNEVPGQVLNLRVLREGKDWILLDWDEAANGGTISAYQIQRRRRDGDGAWTNVGMAVDSEVLLTGQESGVEFEYQVTARNKTGEGPPSNIVRAVL